jgi:hypothetical protein
MGDIFCYAAGISFCSHTAVLMGVEKKEGKRKREMNKYLQILKFQDYLLKYLYHI